MIRLNLYYQRAFYFFFLIYNIWSIRLNSTNVLKPFLIRSVHLDIEGLRTTPKILTLHQSINGNIWFASTKGLIAYHVTKSTLWPTEKPVTALYSDAQNVLWAGLENGTILSCVEGHCNQMQYQGAKPTTKITAIASDHLGQIWFSTYGEGVFVLSKQGLVQLNEQEGLGSNEVYGLKATKNQTILIHTDKGLAEATYRPTFKKIVNKAFESELPDIIIPSLEIDSDGTAWAGTNDQGPFSFDPISGTVLARVHKWPYGEINSLSCTGNYLWVSTKSEVLLRVDKKNLNLVDSIVVPKSKIIQLYDDLEGNTWILTESELFVVDKRFLQRQTDLQSIQSVLATNEKVWLGTNEGLYVSEKGKAYHRVKSNPINVLSIFQGKNKVIWVGTFGQGLYSLSPGSDVLRWHPVNRKLADPNIFDITEFQDQLWIATLSGAYKIQLPDDSPDVQGPVICYNKKSGLTGDFIYKILIDSKQRIWLGTDGQGINVIEPSGQIIHITMIDSTKLGAVYSLVEDFRGHIWARNFEDKLVTIDDAYHVQWQNHINVEQQKIQSMTSDERGNILIVFENNLQHYYPATGDCMDYNLIINGVDFKPSFNTISRAEDGTLILGDASRLVLYQPLENEMIRKPKLRFVEFFANGKKTAMHPQQFFDYKTNFLTFAFEGFWPLDQAKLKYRYRLNGLDTRWTQTNETSISYPAIPPGTYHLKIQASLTSGFFQSSEINYSFKIQEAFWKQWWFVSFLIAGFSGVVYFLMNERENKIVTQYSIQQEKIASQLDILRSQINPHFLFNSFNTLILTIEESPEKAIKYVEHLSDFFRNILAVRDKNLITLEEEFKLLQAYVYLLAQRYGDNFSIQWPESIPQGWVVPLTMQILVENAVKHNIISVANPLVINIEFIQEGKLVVRNKLQPKAKKQAGTNFGLKSLQTQYQLLTARWMNIEITNTDFIVYVPIIHPQEVPLNHSNQHEDSNH